MEIPAITIWQPWASLLACGAKRYETRGWETKYRGPIAIHAAAKKPPRQKELPWKVLDAIINAITEAFGHWSRNWDNIPLGSIIAVAELTECWKITDNGHTVGSDKAARIEGGKYGGRVNIIEGDEILFGDWTPGRYAWELANINMLPKPIPAKGKQGLWRWEVPEGVKL
jgi:hypothetical protein